ncbi:MAG TPA: sugar transferase [Candidatus Saccharimonadales bacterium]|nr:sugar transferase [Candidatus Saccharimonadales bacterium]
MVYDFVKLCFDIFAALFGLIILSPILIVCALLVKITSEGPILVEESNRVGKNGKIFRMYKFRTMVKNSHQMLRSEPKMKELLEEYKKNSFKLSADPRVTPIGKFLRRASLDELPQFLNILKGEMSLIGPRAYYPDELEEQKKNYPNCSQFIAESLSVKPGMTGLWQVSGRSRIGFEQRIQMDASYAKAKSILLDLKILLKTPFALFQGEGFR